MTQLIALHYQSNVTVTKIAANREAGKIGTPQINSSKVPEFRQNTRTKNKFRKLNKGIQVPISDLYPILPLLQNQRGKYNSSHHITCALEKGRRGKVLCQRKSASKNYKQECESKLMKAYFRIADRKVLFHILLHPFLFLRMRKTIQDIIFEPSSPVIFLLYSDRRSLERLTFNPGADVYVWRTWKNEAHYIGICFRLVLVRKTLIHNVLHEIGHVICHETNHESHIVSPELLRQVQEALKEKETIYRQALSELFTSFPLLRKTERMCQGIDIGQILKEFYANDVMIKYSAPEKRLEELTAEAEDICHGLNSFIENLPLLFTNPFTVLNTVLVSVVSESSAVRLSRQATRLRNKLKRSQNRLNELYKGFPSEARKLRKELIPFFVNLSATPSSSDGMEYIFWLQGHILNFYDTYTRWLRRVKDTLRNATLKDLVNLM